MVCETKLDDLPEDVIARGKLVLADSIGCIAAGGTLPEVQHLIRTERALGGPSEATVLGGGAQLPRASAAFVNGTAGTWHDLDEGNLSTKTHAGIQLVPAALAEAEAEGLSGGALLEATILAYEASARLWRATTARLAVHPHGTYGPLAAALAVGKLRGLPVKSLSNAAGMALTMGLAASRKTLSDGATVRNIYTGMSGRNGFEALVLDAAGFSSEADAATSILGSIYGTAFDAEAAVGDLGKTWWIRRNYFKRFASGRYTHGALDLVEAAKARHGAGFIADRIARIDVSTYFFAATLAQQSARTPFGVRFSIPMLMAAHLLYGPPPLTDDCAGLLADPAVNALAARIFVKESKDATAAYPDRQPTQINITYEDGSQETFSSERTLGESDNPLPIAQLQAKFTELVEASWSGGSMEAWSDLLSIEQIDDVGRMIRRWLPSRRQS
jgi:2-methylcitrate dehydratase PrpD